MADMPVQSSSDDVALMADFLEKHSTPPAQEEGESRRAASDTKPPAQEAPVQEIPPKGEVEEISEMDLDAKTLEQLGLVQPEEVPKTSGGDSDGEGTQEQSVDLDTLASTLGLQGSDLVLEDGQVRLRTKIDGEAGQVSLDELRKGYQLQSHFTRQQEAFLEERKQWEEAKAQQQQQFEAQATIAQEILRAQEANLDKEYTLNWDALREQDPAEWAAKMTEYQTKRNGLQQQQQTVVQKLQQQREEQMQEFQKQHQDQMAAEARKLTEAMGWKDMQDQNASVEQVRSYLVGQYAFAPETMEQMQDHRHFLLADKARRWDELQEKLKLTRKKVRETHVVPSGEAAKPQSGKRRAVSDAQKKLRSTGSVKDAANVFQQLGIV